MRMIFLYNKFEKLPRAGAVFDEQDAVFATQGRTYFKLDAVLLSSDSLLVTKRLNTVCNSLHSSELQRLFERIFVFSRLGIKWKFQSDFYIKTCSLRGNLRLHVSRPTGQLARIFP